MQVEEKETQPVDLVADEEDGGEVTPDKIVKYLEDIIKQRLALQKENIDESSLEFSAKEIERKHLEEILIFAGINTTDEVQQPEEIINPPSEELIEEYDEQREIQKQKELDKWIDDMLNPDDSESDGGDQMINEEEVDAMKLKKKEAARLFEEKRLKEIEETRRKYQEINHDKHRKVGFFVLTSDEEEEEEEDEEEEGGGETLAVSVLPQIFLVEEQQQPFLQKEIEEDSSSQKQQREFVEFLKNEKIFDADILHCDNHVDQPKHDSFKQQQREDSLEDCPATKLVEDDARGMAKQLEELESLEKLLGGLSI